MERQRNQRSNCQHSLDHRECKGIPEKHLLLLNWPWKAFDCVDNNKLWKIIKEVEMPYHLTCLLRNLYVGQEATVRTLYWTIDWFKIGKGVHQGCLFLPIYLSSMQSTSCEISSWIQDIKICRWFHSNGKNWRGTKEPLMRVKEGSEKPGLNLNIKNKSKFYISILEK